MRKNEPSSKDRLFVFGRKETLIFVVFAVFVFLFYANSLFHGFVLDDRAQIEQNPQIRSILNLPKIIFGCAFEANRQDCVKDSFYYRPIHTLLNLLVYQVSVQPWIFHFVNLVVFLFAACLVFIFSKLFSKNRFFSLLTALLFIIHPIHTEVVNWASAVPELLSFVFVLLSMINYLYYRRTKRPLHLILNVVSYFLALLSKESALPIVPLAIFGLDLLLFRINVKKLLRFEELKKYFLLAGSVVVYFLMRLAAIGGLNNLPTRGNHFSIAEAINVFFRLFVYCLKGIFFPYPLRFVHYFQISSDLLGLSFILSFLAFLALFLFFLFLARRKSVLAFFLFCLFIFFLPVYVFFVVAGDNVFAERYLFLPSLGACWLIAYFLSFLWQKDYLIDSQKISSLFAPILSAFQPHKKRRIFVLGLLIFLFLSAWLIVFTRNKIWKNNITLFRTTLLQTPQASHIREYLADELLAAGDFEAAKTEDEEILKREPEYMYISHVYGNLADYYRQKGEPEKAEEYYLKAIEASADKSYKSYNNLGAFYLERGEYLKALPYFCKAIQIDAGAPEPQSNLSRIASVFGSNEENLPLLYADVTAGGIFKKSEETRIKYTKNNCSDKICLFRFSTQLASGEILLPFLIMGVSDSGTALGIANPSFDQQNNEITLEVNSKYRGQVNAFIFPNCEGKYYQTTISHD